MLGFLIYKLQEFDVVGGMKSFVRFICSSDFASVIGLSHASTAYREITLELINNVLKPK